jgi:hypothetical protein
VKYVHWTTSERRKLIEMHRVGYPTSAQLREALPRHSVKSILSMVRHFGIRRNRSQINWLRFAHQHYANREEEHRA